MNRSMRPIAAAGLAALLLAGCGESSAPSSGANETSGPAPEGWLLASEPAGARAIADAKADAGEGEEIVVTGRIGGRAEPISSESGTFLIVDLELPHCGVMEEPTQCATPWDYCCELPADVADNAATVQLVDESGRPLEVDPVAAGLEPLDEVVVVGTVGPRPSPRVLTIRATGVHRRGG